MKFSSQKIKTIEFYDTRFVFHIIFGGKTIYECFLPSSFLSKTKRHNLATKLSTVTIMFARDFPHQHNTTTARFSLENALESPVFTEITLTVHFNLKSTKKSVNTYILLYLYFKN